MNGSDNISLRPIGLMETPWTYLSSLPRQPNTLVENFGFIRWTANKTGSTSFPQKKIAVLFSFHQNKTWKPLVQPPRGSSDKKRGVFATRAPYRPNEVGLSFVDLIAFNNQGLWIKNHDLIHGTPILSIENLSPCDGATHGWLKDLKILKIIFLPLPKKQIDFLKIHGEFTLESAIKIWLSNEPMNSKEKRVEQLSDKEGVFFYRTWRAQFELKEETVTVLNIFSGYSPNELMDKEDPYLDKSLHRKFSAFFDLLK